MRKRSIFKYIAGPLLLLCGLAITILGGVVFYGLRTGSVLLTRVFERYPVLPYSGAFGFVICGIGLLALFFRHARLSMACGGISTVVGGLTLLQYVYGVDLNLDPSGVRDAPNSAVSFVAIGIAFIFMNMESKPKHRLVVSGLLSSIVLALGLVALFGYVSGVETAYGWGRLSRMAFHAAAGFLLLGTGFFVYAWREGVAAEAGTPGWLAIPIFVWLFTFAFALWQALEAAGTDQTLSRLVLAAGSAMAFLIALTVHYSHKAEVQAREVGLANEVLEGEIQDRKRAEEAVRATNRQLNHTLAELRQTQDGLIKQERLSVMGQMAGGIAHDVNNALTIITGYCELLIGYPDHFDDKRKTLDAVKAIQTAAEDAASVVRRLPELYRRSDQQKTIFPLSLNQIVKEVTSLTQPKWKDQALRRGATIEVAMELEDIPLIGSDKSALREVLTNLIFNAVDAMPQGGRLTLKTRADDKFACVEVQDTGTGMSEEVKRRCLEPFFSTKEGRGTGLGLSLAQGIVHRFGGSIEVASTLGVGSCFTVKFPLHDPSVINAMQSEAEAEGAPQGSFRILAVEDEPAVRVMLTQLLEMDNHRVETANGGEEALKRFEARPFDLVITDNAMPGMIGEQVATAIKRIDASVPIIMLTGFADLMKARDEVPQGVDLLIGKPVTLATLRKAIREVTQAKGVA
jgi:signal transduction histidine kinase/ActR/RegA family two-component response regulator